MLIPVCDFCEKRGEPTRNTVFKGFTQLHVSGIGYGSKLLICDECMDKYGFERNTDNTDPFIEALKDLITDTIDELGE